MAKWDNVTQATLNNYLTNRGALPYSPDNDLGTIEGNIRGIVRDDFSIELDFSRHLKFDANPFYAAPNVEKILKDSDKEEYRRLYDQYSQTKYTLQQLLSAYHFIISEQDDYIKKNVSKPDCDYQKNGNFQCR